MANLITKTDIAVHRQISDSVYDNVINQHIEDAQFMELKNLIGSSFYNKIVNDVASFSNLLDGSEYDFEGTSYSHEGIKRVLIYYSYARYIRFGSSTDTPFGFVQKETPDSSSVSTEEKNIIFKQNQQIGFAYWEDVKLFLDRTDPDGWSEAGARGTRIKISKIS